MFVPQQYRLSIVKIAKDDYYVMDPITNDVLVEFDRKQRAVSFAKKLMKALVFLSKEVKSDSAALGTFVTNFINGASDAGGDFNPIFPQG